MLRFGDFVLRELSVHDIVCVTVTTKSNSAQAADAVASEQASLVLKNDDGCLHDIDISPASARLLMDHLAPKKSE